MRPSDNLARYYPKWTRGLTAVGVIVTLGFFVAMLIHAMQGDSSFALVRNICGLVAPAVGIQSGQAALMVNVGKKAAGRLFDGRLHDDMPVPASRPAALEAAE